MDEAGDVAGLREELARHRASRRYPAELVTRVLGYLARRRRAGAKVDEVAGELGVQRQGLHRWQRERRRAGLSLRPVVMAKATPMVGTVVATGPVLFAPRGVRVEGLGIEDLARVLRGLE